MTATTTPKTATALTRLTKARVLLLLDQPFFGTLATRLETVIDPDIDTACTDGKQIRWSPDFIAKLSDAELKFVLAHEVMHVANGHCWRRGGRDAERWNVAADKTINELLRASNLVAPKDALFPDAGEAGKSAEAIYSMLAEKAAENQQPGAGKPGDEPAEDSDEQSEPGDPDGTEGQGGSAETAKDPGGCGGVEDAPDGDAGSKEQEADWKVAITQAAAAARSQGKMPGDLQRLVNQIVNPKVPWSVILRDFVERSARNDYNWAVANRRHLGRGIILPSLVSEELPEIVIAVDTSGSIGQAELDQFAAEVSAVLAAYETTIRILYCDTRINAEQIVTRADLPLTLTPHGGGGTDFRPVFDHVAKQGLSPAALVYLTDCYGQFPSSAPEYPVLWVSIVEGSQVPFGELVELK